jgi:hypothetical protein
LSIAADGLADAGVEPSAVSASWNDRFSSAEPMSEPWRCSASSTVAAWRCSTAGAIAVDGDDAKSSNAPRVSAM